MQRTKRVLLLSLMILFIAARANAVTVFRATLTGGQEVPANLSGASGIATFILNDAQTALTFTATIVGLDFTGNQTPNNPNDNLINAHIHASGTSVPGVNGGVVWGFFGSPFNDNNPNDVVNTPLANGVGGTISGKWDAPEGNNTTLAAQLPNIFAGRGYINFHTAGIPGGEIRGQILPAPEPSALLLVAVGMLLVGFVMRFRHGR